MKDNSTNPIKKFRQLLKDLNAELEAEKVKQQKKAGKNVKFFNERLMNRKKELKYRIMDGQKGPKVQQLRQSIKDCKSELKQAKQEQKIAETILNQELKKKRVAKLQQVLEEFNKELAIVEKKETTAYVKELRHAIQLVKKELKTAEQLEIRSRIEEFNKVINGLNQELKKEVKSRKPYVKAGLESTGYGFVRESKLKKDGKLFGLSLNFSALRLLKKEEKGEKKHYDKFLDQYDPSIRETKLGGKKVLSSGDTVTIVHTSHGPLIKTEKRIESRDNAIPSDNVEDHIDMIVTYEGFSLMKINGVPQYVYSRLCRTHTEHFLHSDDYWVDPTNKFEGVIMDKNGKMIKVETERFSDLIIEFDDIKDPVAQEAYARWERLHDDFKTAYEQANEKK